MVEINEESITFRHWFVTWNGICMKKRGCFTRGKGNGSANFHENTLNLVPCSSHLHRHYRNEKKEPVLKVSEHTGGTIPGAHVEWQLTF